MDWKLSKSIYIVVFLLINIILLIVLYNQNQSYDATESSKNQSIEQSENYKTNVNSKKEIKLTVLNGTRKEFQTESDSEKTMNYGVLKNVKEVPSLPFERSEIKEYIDKEMYKGSDYTYNANASTKKAMYYNQMYNSLPIFNHSAARIKASKTENGVRIEQGYITDITLNEYSQVTVVNDPIEIAEELAKEKVISKDAVIESATLGYYLVLLNDDNEQVLLRPKWKLIISERDLTRVIYVDAINATEEIIEGE